MSVREQQSVVWWGPDRSAVMPDFLYLAFALTLVVGVSAVHLWAPSNIVSYERDVWHHLAVLNELLKSPFHAVNPHIVSDAPSRTFMPWYVLLAIIGRGVGLDAQQLLGISAFASVTALVVGARLFARAYFADRWAPILFLAVLFGTWFGGPNHTGFHSISTLLYSASYPFNIVLALGFFTWWAVLRALRAPAAPIGAFCAIALLVAFMFTTHQLQGAFAIGGALTFALFHGHAAFRRRCQIMAVIVAGIVLCQFWPYFDPIAFSFAGENFTYVYQTRIEWTSAPGMFGALGLSVIGAVGLYDFRRRAWRRDLAIAVGAIFAGILAMRALGWWIGLRFLPFLAVFLQIALTAWLLDLRSGASSTGIRRAILPMLLVASTLNAALAALDVAGAQLYLAGRADPRSNNWSRDILAAMTEVKAQLGPGAVVLAEGNTAYPIQASDMKVVSIPRPFPEVADSVERQAASIAFFSSDTSTAERCAILARYGVAALIYRSERVPPDVRQSIDALGSHALIRDLALVRLPASAPAACLTAEAEQP
jgi:hypothetical protein